MPRAIAVTGVGMICPLGVGCDAAFARLLAGQSGLRRIERLARAFPGPTPIGAEVCAFDPRPAVGKGARWVDRYCQLALVAAGGALGDAGVDPAQLDGRRLGVVIGSNLCALASSSAFVRTYCEEGFAALHPMHVPNTILNTAASRVSIRFGIQGCALSLLGSGLSALRVAADLLHDGDLDLVLAGAVEEITAEALLGYQAAGLLAPGALEPAAALRPLGNDGFGGTALGEGACVLALERLGEARARGARVRARLGEPVVTFVPELHGACRRPPARSAAVGRVFAAALAAAGLSRAEVGGVLLGANGTPWDRLEAAEVAAVAPGVPAAAIKAALGEAQAASALLQTGFATLALQRGVLPPTLNHEPRGGDRGLPGLAPVAQPLRRGAVLVTTLFWDGAAGAVTVLAADGSQDGR